MRTARAAALRRGARRLPAGTDAAVCADSCHGREDEPNDLIFVTQRAQLLDITIVSQGSVRVAFKRTDKNDLNRGVRFF